MKKITASKGKVFKRISDKAFFGKEIYLGYTHYLNGELLDEPLLELPEHFEEIDEPVTEETPVMDEETPLEEETPTSPEPEEKELKKITVADYLALEEKVNKLLKIIENGGTE